jgi:hypothetical protein
MNCPHCNKPIHTHAAAAALGKRGGAAGRGASKRRGREHYVAAGKASAEARKLAKARRETTV